MLSPWHLTAGCRGHGTATPDLSTCWNALEDAGYDQSTYAGQIGLFGGCSLNTYLLAKCAAIERLIDEVTGSYQVGEFRSFMGNDKDFLTDFPKVRQKVFVVSHKQAELANLVASRHLIDEGQLDRGTDSPANTY